MRRWLLLAAALCAAPALAGTVSPDLEAKLAAVHPGTPVAVIVELTSKADTRAVAAVQSNRKGRGRAVVEALKSVAERQQPPLMALLAREQARKVRPFWVINGVALEAPEALIRRIAARDDVREVRADRKIPRPVPKPSATPTVSSADPAWNIDMIRAPEVWALDPRYTGQGVVVGSFDTGVDGTHPDLAPRYRGNNAISWFDPYGEHAAPYDNNGHGTHTVGTMVGGDLSGYSIGVAPNAQWIAAKGWDDAENATASAFHEIFQWFLAPGGDPANAPQVVNGSWGMDTTLCDTEFVSDVQAFRSAGILPVFAAGNSGPDPQTILSPGAYGTSFTVGSTDFNDDISFFSSEGPSSCTGGVKPDIAAPGEFILSTWPGGDYAYLDGTSMATPHVSGAAAVLLSIDPTLTVEELEAALESGALDLDIPGPDNAFGYGRLDLAESARIALGIEKYGIAATVPTAYESPTTVGVFTVSRTGATDTALTITYTVSGTATPGVDYVTLPGTVTIPVGASSTTIVVQPIDDDIFEHDESIIVALDPNPNFVVGPKQATVTLVSNELAPDLVVTAMGAPSGAGAGATITVTDTTRNQGAGSAQASATRFYLSSNNVLDAADAMVGFRAVPTLAPGASSAGSTTLTIPASLAGGTYYLFAKADGEDAVIEGNESNNLYAALITVGADLVVSSFTVPPAAGVGASFTLADTTKNQGPGTAPASQTNYYLSTDAVLDASDVVLGARAIPVLAPGASDSGSVSVTIPAGTPTGTYYVFAKADAAGAVSEVSEANNTAMGTLQVGADLVVTSIVAPATAGAGTTISVTDTTKNQGGGAAPATTTRFFLSANNLLDASDVALGGRAVATLAPGTSSTGTTSLAIPAATPSGTYYLIARADGDDALAETSEANNLYAVPIVIGGDLVVSSFTAPTDTGAGLTVTLSDTTRNQGAGSAPATTTSYYLSADSALDAFDVLLGSRAVAALAAGASDTGSVAVTIPAGTATGTYYLFAKADAGNVATETAEGNNTAVRTVRIGPDLVVGTFTAPPSGGAGGTITVTDTTRNLGGGSAPATVTRFYLSANNALDASDLLLGARAVSALAPGASESGTTSLTIPAGTASGTYYLFAKADGADAVAETSEANNLYATTLTLGADLVVSAMTVPLDAGAGMAIAVGDTTKNQGAGASTASTTSYYLSANALLDAGDVLLGSRPVAPLAPNATDSGTITVTIPAGTATGTYYVFAKADADGVVGETAETNNTAYRTLRVGPDLAIASFTVPPTAGAGGSITVTDTTRNLGGGAAPATSTRFYLSANNALDAGDVLLGARPVGALAAGASDSASTVLAMPAGTLPGTYYVFAKADGDDALVETQEGNNFYAATITVGPDLVVSALTVPTVGGAGLAITVTDTTRNQGAGVAPPSTTTYYLSANAGLDASDVVLGSRSVPSLAAGATDTGSLTVTLPAGLATGTYYVFVKADGGDGIAEVSEANNVAYRSISIGPDLLVASFTSTASVAAGGTFTVNDTTRNQGGGTAPASNTRYYLSANNVIDAADVMLGARAVAALPPGSSDAGSVTLTIPPGTAARFYYLFAKADGDDALAETSEGNNLYAVVIQVTP